MKQKKTSIKKNYLYNLIYTLLNTALPLLTAPYLARTIGVEATGTYAYYYSIAHFFFIFAKLGLTNYGTREISRVRDTGKLSIVFSEIYYQQLLVAFIVNIIYGVFCFCYLKADPGQIFALILWIIVFGGLIDIDWLFSGLEAFKLISVRNSIVKIITVALIFLLVKKPDDLWKYALLMALGFFMGHVSIWINANKFVRFVKVNIRDVLKHIRPNFILVIPVVAMSVYKYMDKIMLGSMSGMINTGLYDNAEKIIYALCGFINSFGTVMMPRMSNLISKGQKEKSEEYICYSMQFMMFMMFGAAFGLLAIAQNLVVVLFGKPFAESGPLMAALAFTLPAMGWSNTIRTQYVVPSGYDSIFIFTISFGAILNLFINWLCIPRFGAMGAVIGTICAEFGVALMQFLLLRHKLGYAKLLKKTLFAPICGMLMYIIISQFANFELGIVWIMLVQIITGVILYLLFTFVYYYIFDRQFIKRFFARAFNSRRSINDN